MDQTATTYSATTVSEMSGATIKTVLEDVADNLFNPDPYYQQGGDMVRVGGMSYAIVPDAKMGARIQDMRLDGRPIEADRKYKVAGWAPVAEGASGEPVWDVVAGWLRARKTVGARKLNTPRIIGMQGNPGLTA
jgi:sulfur-oxidizing protein SoxB